MFKPRRIIILSLGIVFFLSCFLYSAENKDVAKGNIIGFVYGQDGTTPLEGAVVKVENVSTGTAYESTKTEANGLFKIVEVESGIYLYGVLTADGGYDSENYFGVNVSEGETAKLAISLTPYEGKVAAALQEVYKAQGKSGEVLVGTVIDYDPGSKFAEVLIVKGFLQLDDKIHAKGKRTDFYQNVKELLLGQSPVRRLFSGQTANLKVKDHVVNGDLIYLIPTKKLFLLPIGIAAVTAATSAVLFTRGEDQKVITCSPFKK